MPQPFPRIAACAALIALAAGAAGQERRAARAPGDPSSFTVMTFNMQHGMDGAHQYNLQRTVDVIARIEPDLVGLQEVTRNHSKYRCDDQPAQLAEGLTRATGRTWYHVYVQEWFVNADRKCLENGNGDGPNTEGLAFLAPEPIETVTHVTLWNSRIGLAVRVPASRGVPVVVTHLANGSRPKSKEDRVRQVGKLLPWAETLGTPRILIGDLNAFAEHPEVQTILETYRDAWSEARNTGTARGLANGATRVGRTSRVDYVLYTPSPRLRLQWARTVDTSELIGVHASDHNPVVAAFSIGEAAAGSR